MFFLPPEYIFLFNIKTSYIIIYINYKNAKKLICKHILRNMNHTILRIRMEKKIIKLTTNEVKDSLKILLI